MANTQQTFDGDRFKHTVFHYCSRETHPLDRNLVFFSKGGFRDEGERGGSVVLKRIIQENLIGKEPESYHDSMLPTVARKYVRILIEVGKQVDIRYRL